ncbi:MAG: uridine kinase [Bacteroidota bacterium]|nr:uridine kinase [Bacteroidota bacterium]
MLIGISGGSGAGKTAFIEALRSMFTRAELGLISMDNYYKPWDQQKVDENGVINFDIPEAIDHEAFLTDLQKLKRHEVVSRPEYTFNNETKVAGDIQIEPAVIYIVEGIFIFHFEPVRDILDLTVLIHAKENLKIIRRIKRDGKERNYALEDVLYRYQYHVAPAYNKFIAPYLDDIDVIINNNNSFDKAVQIMAYYISKKIEDLTEKN